MLGRFHRSTSDFRPVLPDFFADVARFAMSSASLGRAAVADPTPRGGVPQNREEQSHDSVAPRPNPRAVSLAREYFDAPMGDISIERVASHGARGRSWPQNNSLS
jgi:hypothetical protein